MLTYHMRLWSIFEFKCEICRVSCCGAQGSSVCMQPTVCARVYLTLHLAFFISCFYPFSLVTFKRYTTKEMHIILLLLFAFGKTNTPEYQCCNDTTNGPHIGCNWFVLCHQWSFFFFNPSAYPNKMMDPLWKQPSRGSEGCDRNAAAQAQPVSRDTHTHTEARQKWVQSNYG